MTKLLNKKEIAELLKVHPNTIDNHRKKGMPCIVSGRIIRFDKKEVINWMKRSAVNKMTLTSRLNFSDTKQNGLSIKVNKWSDINHHETLCMYCADNNISLKEIEETDFDSCVTFMEIHGMADKNTDHYYFWIDKE